MKTLVIFMVVLMMSMLSITESRANNVSLSICEYIAADDKSRLRKLLKINKLKVRGIYKGISCNGVNILVFAAQKNATKVGEILIKKLPKSVVEAEQEAINSLSAELGKIAAERIN